MVLKCECDDTEMTTAILTETEYRLALKALEPLMTAKPGSPEEEELEQLATAIEAYEEEHYPIEEPTPEELQEDAPA